MMETPSGDKSLLRLGAVLGLLGFLVQMAIVIGDAMT
jgi:hypothetical protein